MRQQAGRTNYALRAKNNLPLIEALTAINHENRYVELQWRFKEEDQ